MKKVLALILAVMMMATVAFAAEGAGIPSDTGVGVGGADKNPGAKLKFGEGDITGTTNKAAVNSSNYSIGKITYDGDSKSLVKSVNFADADDRLVIELVQNYELDKAKTLKMKVELKGKKASGKKTRPDDVTVYVAKDLTAAPSDNDYKNAAGLAVYYPTTKIAIDSNYDLATAATTSNNKTVANTALPTLAAVDKTIYKFVTAEKDASEGYNDAGQAYATLNLATADDDVEIEGRVYDGEKLFLANNVDANKDILKTYADVDAELDFLTFKASPSFNSTVTVRFYKDEDTKIYGVKDGKPTNINAKWNDDEGCFVLKTRTLGAYVFSDKTLNVATTVADDNPDTGANDVVGIAGALAAVALVSAAAVSLKK